MVTTWAPAKASVLGSIREASCGWLMMQVHVAQSQKRLIRRPGLVDVTPLTHEFHHWLASNTSQQRETLIKFIGSALPTPSPNSIHNYMDVPNSLNRIRMYVCTYVHNAMVKQQYNGGPQCNCESWMFGGPHFFVRCCNFGVLHFAVLHCHARHCGCIAAGWINSEDIAPLAPPDPWAGTRQASTPGRALSASGTASAPWNINRRHRRVTRDTRGFKRTIPWKFR